MPYTIHDIDPGLLFNVEHANIFLTDNFLAIYDSPFWEFTGSAAADYSSSSAAYVAISSDFEQQIETDGGDLAILFRGSLGYASAGYIGFAYELDGIVRYEHALQGQIFGNGTTWLLDLSMLWVISGLIPGTHTVKLWWQPNGNALTLYAGGGTGSYPQMSLWEI